MAAPDFAHLQTLKADGQSDLLATHLIQLLRSIDSRDNALRLRKLVDELPERWRAHGQWPLALAWTGLRASDSSLIEEALAYGLTTNAAFFQGILAFRRQEPQQAADLTAETRCGSDAVTRAIALQLYAQAAMVRGEEGWQKLYEEAISMASGRDRGVIRISYATALNATPSRARAEYMNALTDVRSDFFWISEVWIFVGYIDLQAGRYREANRAFERALDAARQQKQAHPETTIYTGLATLFSALGAYPRALHFYSKGLENTLGPQQYCEIHISVTLALAAYGRQAEALEKITDLAAEQGVLHEGQHFSLSTLAAIRILNGDYSGAYEALQRSTSLSAVGILRYAVAQAELYRQEGDLARAQEAMAQADSHLLPNMRTLGRLFPEVYAMRGVVVETPPWTIRCSLAGPVRAWMYDIELKVRPTRPAAGLLALLVTHGGRVSRERALDALNLPGRTPDARRKALSAAVAELREILGWPDSVQVQGGVLALSEEPVWLEPQYPTPGREDLFCEGRYDPWIVDWRSEHIAIN